jgi:shikimate kinase
LIFQSTKTFSDFEGANILSIFYLSRLSLLYFKVILILSNKNTTMIILLGYMGSGKSSVGRYLSKNKNLSYCDLDNYIEEKEKMSISEIFQSKGEIYFRKIEHLYLKDILRNKIYQILSLGGGTPCYAGNISLINARDIDSFYLKVDLDTLTERLFNQKGKRPLLNEVETKVELKGFIRKHIFEREYYYRQAKHILKVSNLSISDIASEILKTSE